MPSFELVVPESFLFIPANLSFISFCFFISFILSKIFKSVILFFVLLVSLLSLVYYDIFIKYAIKNYYSLTQMDSKVYLQPTKNSESKIDSLSMIGVYIYPLKYSTDLTQSEREEIKVLHESYIDKFIDISTYAHKYNRYIYNTQRVYLNSNVYENTKNEETNPRFEILKKIQDTFLPKIYGKYEYKFIDKKTNVVFATAFNIFFVNSYNKFRNKYLFWTHEKEDEFNPDPIQNFDIIYKKVFID
ncbi:MAG: hypothetical protein RBQ84_01860 [Arcobacter sp.]|jgi:hypothetical protein|uniref:hypothetical protein n=1 Tax=Arcobacter sp. TaxID=1872629 RepID=UPI002A765295|nr:hypothetical protein [Arcobacter sp.]MDY3199675.1 hypothetical protein [Arcobacter sp.]